MNRRDRRDAVKEIRRAHRGHGFACSCTHLGLLLFEGDCPKCGVAYSLEGWMPTSGMIGDRREMGAPCPGRGCGGELEGVAVVMATEHL
jgi:hypothetical protein